MMRIEIKIMIPMVMFMIIKLIMLTIIFVINETRTARTSAVVCIGSW